MKNDERDTVDSDLESVTRAVDLTIAVSVDIITYEERIMYFCSLKYILQKMYTVKSGSSENHAKRKQATASWPKWAKTFWKVYFILFGLVCLMFFFISLGWMGYMPSFAELENPDSNLATEVISSD
ncbi:MAG: hypothetical protein II046_05820, partial [Clostridiales bacterium]|nr:hypothetical protein [Clostridiales bacterium]